MSDSVLLSFERVDNTKGGKRCLHGSDGTAELCSSATAPSKVASAAPSLTSTPTTPASLAVLALPVTAVLAAVIVVAVAAGARPAVTEQADHVLCSLE